MFSLFALNFTNRATVTLQSASNGDFTVLSSTDLTFSPGDTLESILISTMQDALIESDEVFFVILSTSSSNVRIDDGITTVTIVDNDSKYTRSKLTTHC